MPSIGEVKVNAKFQKFIWAACEHCGKERWNLIVRGMPVSKLCRTCNPKVNKTRAGMEHKRIVTKEGYIWVFLEANDFFRLMAGKNGYVREHRLVMAKHLARCLLTWETVHHKGTEYPMGSKEDKGDNRIENLELLPSPYKHDALTRMRNYIKKLEKEVDRLQRELERKS